MTTPPSPHAAPQVQLRPEHRLYLGLDPADGHKRVWSTTSDTAGIVGPPRYGKTSGLIIPALLYWAGPAVVTSTRGDILSFCGDWRRRLAGPRGGRVYVYDPFNSEGGGTMRWSPVSGCQDPAVCYRRVQGLVGAAGSGLSDAHHWQAGAAMILRGVLHAAALGGVPMGEVRRWLAVQETRRPAQILRQHTGTAATGWADDLEAAQLLGDRERGSFYSVARNSLEATAEPHVLASTEGDDLDIDHFLSTDSTLFIVGPSHYQDAVAPLIVGLVDAIAQRAAETAAAQGGRLARPLLLALDEVANIAPLQSLPGLVSEGGGRGIITMWAAQSLAQLRSRYGTEAQEAILTATTAKLIYGGMSNETDLRNISTWGGERRVTEVTTHSPTTDPTDHRQRPATTRTPAEHPYSISGTYRPVLPVEAIRQMPPHHAWLWWQSEPPLHVATPPAGTIGAYAAVRGYTP